MPIIYDNEEVKSFWDYSWREGTYLRRHIFTGEFQWWNGIQWETYKGVAKAA